MMNNRLSFSAMDISEKNPRERRKPPERSTFARISRRFSSKKDVSSNSGQTTSVAPVQNSRMRFRDNKPISFSRPDLSTNQMPYSVVNQPHFTYHHQVVAQRSSQNNLDRSGYAPVVAIRKTSTGHSRLSLLSIGCLKQISILNYL